MDSPVEQEANPAISREGWSHATDVLGTPGNSGDAGVLYIFAAKESFVVLSMKIDNTLIII